MSLLKTPICDFGKKFSSFSLISTQNRKISFEDSKGKNGTLLMFICNHCPYVKAVIKEITYTVKTLNQLGVNSLAVMPNDVKKVPEDSFENMKIFSKENLLNFPYLYDVDQKVSKKYMAVCTPDFFGFNRFGELQYRGRITHLRNLVPQKESKMIY